MLDIAYQTFLNRMKATESEQWPDESWWKDINFPVKPIPLQKIDVLELKDWELSAVDFHCTNIDELLAKHLEHTIPVPKLRSLIWSCSSSVNNRASVPYSSYRPQKTDAADMKLWEDRVAPLYGPLAIELLRQRR